MSCPTRQFNIDRHSLRTLRPHLLCVSCWRSGSYTDTRDQREIANSSRRECVGAELEVDVQPFVL